MDFDADESVEQTLMMARECFVYKIPPRTSTTGYRAADWNVNEWIWSGRIKVVGKGTKCTINLEDPQTALLFASCIVNTSGEAESVEPVLDSSRYFVLRIEDGSGRHAFIGLGFKERSEAMDFTIAIQDHKKYVERQKNPTPAAAAGPAVDYSLQAGQTIHINLKAKDGKKAVVNTGGSGSGSGSSAVPLLAPPSARPIAPLAPPPSAGAMRTASAAAPAPAAVSKSIADMSLDDLLK